MPDLREPSYSNPFIGHALYSPAISVTRAQEISKAYFGIDGELAPLASHQDQNFAVTTGAGRYVLKIANRQFERSELALQNRVMEHLDGRIAVEVPRVRPALDGSDIVEVDGHHVRLLTYLHGELLEGFGYFAGPVLSALGRIAGQTVVALESFAWTGEERMLQWDLRHAPAVVEALAPQLPDRTGAELSRRVINTAARLLDPLLSELPLQVIHNDIVDWNVICEPSDDGRPVPVGLIDFGDVTHSYRVGELAVAATACICHRVDDPLQAVAAVAAAFHQHAGLTEPEIDAIWPLVLARAASVAVSTAQQAELDADNAYVAASAQHEWLTLRLIAAVPPSLARAALRRACGSGPWQSLVQAHRRFEELGKHAHQMVELAEPVAMLDLSPTSPILDDGRWNHELVDADAEGSVLVGRWGEARLIYAAPHAPRPVPTLHLGVDVFAGVGTPVLAPYDATVADVRERELTLERDGIALRAARIEPEAEPADRVTRGQVVGRLAPGEDDDRLPPHLHIQIMLDWVEPISEHQPPPGLGDAGLREEWLWLCPDPSPLVGVAAAAEAPDVESVRAGRDQHVASPQLHYYERPPMIERGWREYLYDEHARCYVDVVNNVAVIGHSHPAVEAAAARQLRLLNTNSRFVYRAMPRFAGRVASLVPEPLDVVFFVSSGSEANDLALRLARHATGARDTLCVQGTYHGWTTATTEVSTGLFENPHAEESRPGWVHPVAMPNTFRGPHRGADAAERYADDVRHVIAELRQGGARPAALIAESLLGYEGGMLPPPGYTRTVAELVRAAGGLFIADEVQLGYGRLGRHFWAFEHEDVIPDIVTIAKSTGNGHPVAAVITSREIADGFGGDASWFSSVGGGPVSCEVGLAVLDVIERERLQENAREIGDHLQGLLHELLDRHELAAAVHGMGLYLGLELVRDRATLEPATAETEAVCERMRTLGVIVQPTGNYQNILKIKPPLVISRSSAEFFVRQLDRVLSEGW